MRKKILVLFFLLLFALVAAATGLARNNVPLVAVISLLLGKQETSGVNHPPVASSLSLSIAPTVQNVVQVLIGADPDGDTVSFDLIAADSGEGYSSATLDPNSGKLYVTILNGFLGQIDLPFRVTDGQLFSSTAHVYIQVADSGSEDNQLGANDPDPRVYSGFEIKNYNGELMGVAGESDAVMPSVVDLTRWFPLPGDQGVQGSCVGWATAYALKSYQERVEVGWPLDSPDHLFSPAYIYNQIKVAGCDDGSYIHQALDLIVSQGAATLTTMPYDQTDCSLSPSSIARTEASGYKAFRWARVEGSAAIKAALANNLPVVLGIDVYKEFYQLRGNDSVYNTLTGTSLGGHAVTAIGYDDSRYGGAFKVINSWGRSWGDEGYFWLPYHTQGIIHQSYVLEDAENNDTSPPWKPVEPEPTHGLPNLQVENWSAEYTPAPGGSGSLQWSVVNTGDTTSASGADVNLMLSRNREITSTDIYIVYEEIPFSLEPGQTAYRDAGNELSFSFPQNLESGEYYMALWVDDFDEIPELNETDNISLGESTVTITDTKPDLVVTSWYAEWNEYWAGTLEYEVTNSGTASVNRNDWDINLVLSPDEMIGNGNEIFIFYEGGMNLESNQSVYRDQSNPAFFSLHSDAFDQPVPSGFYYMALWVDDLQRVDEANELNNVSLGGGGVSIIGQGLAAPMARTYNKILSASDVVSRTNRAYNGKVMPHQDRMVRKVRISRTLDGGYQMKILANATPTFSKVIRSENGVVFPVTQRTPITTSPVR